MAEQREEHATEAEAAARQTLEDSASRVEEFSSQRESLMQQHAKVQKALNPALWLDLAIIALPSEAASQWVLGIGNDNEVLGIQGNIFK